MSNRVRPYSHGHIAPFSSYIYTWLGLLFLTIITVAASYIDMGGALNIIVALGIACVKASLVVVYFMHLSHDESFTSFYGIIFPLIVLSILIIMGLLDVLLRIIPAL